MGDTCELTLDLAGLGWRTIFFVNGPVGVLLVLAAVWLMPPQTQRKPARLDLASVLVLFAGLALLVGPLVFGREFGWPQWLLAMMAAGAVLLAVFPRVERLKASEVGSAAPGRPVNPACSADPGRVPARRAGTRVRGGR